MLFHIVISYPYAIGRMVRIRNYDNCSAWGAKYTGGLYGYCFVGAFDYLGFLSEWLIAGV
jgi:hypothetical protein